MNTYLYYLTAFLFLFLTDQVRADSPEPLTWKNSVKALIYDEDEEIDDGSSLMKLETPYRALDAAVVPVTVKFTNPIKGLEPSNTNTAFIKIGDCVYSYNPLTGVSIESNNQYASVGWRNKNEKIWNIYQKNQLIQTNQEFEVLLFKPGYKTLIQHFEK